MSKSSATRSKKPPKARQGQPLPPEVLRRAMMNRLSRLEAMIVQIERSPAVNELSGTLLRQTQDMKATVNELWVLLSAM